MPNRRIIISNNVAWHYEVIESVIVNYNKFFNIDKLDNDEIYLHVIKDFFISPQDLNYNSFISYISNKYPGVKIIDNFIEGMDYEIHCTVTGSDYDISYGGIRVESIKDDITKAYISHDLVEEFFDKNNIYFLNNFDKKVEDSRIFNATVLPYQDKKIRNKIPQIIIQGSLDMAILNKTRDYDILKDILSGDYEEDFNIKIIGRSTLKRKDIESFFYSLCKNKKNYEKIRIFMNEKWKQYHTHFIDGYAVIPLISKKDQPQYFSTKITSSFNYGRAYDLKFFVDSDFAEAYDVSNNCHIYNSKNVVDEFKKLLKEYKTEE